MQTHKHTYTHTYKHTRTNTHVHTHRLLVQQAVVEQDGGSLVQIDPPPHLEALSLPPHPPSPSSSLTPHTHAQAASKPLLFLSSLDNKTKQTARHATHGKIINRFVPKRLRLNEIFLTPTSQPQPNSSNTTTNNNNSNNKQTQARAEPTTPLQQRGRSPTKHHTHTKPQTWVFEERENVVLC